MRASVLRKFSPVFFITLVVFISVILLSFTESFTGPIVEKRLRQQVVDQMMDIFPNIDDFDYDEEIDIYILYTGGESIGYAFLAVGAGYGGDISILVGLEDSQTVKGVIILAQTETPGIGTRAMEPAFLDQFSGLAISDIAFEKDGGLIKRDSVTGATVSSSAIIKAVKETAMEKVKLIEQGAN